MNLVLIRPNDMKAVYGDTHKYVACEPPYWAGIVANYVRNKGLEVQILDSEAFNLSPEDVANEIKKISPSLVGVMVTGSNLSASTQKMNGAGLICDAIKEATPNTPIFMWGLHPAALPERTMEEENIDFVVKGEGLDTIVDLLNSIISTPNIEEIPADVLSSMDGLYYRTSSGEINGNNNLNIKDIGEVPQPAWDLMPMERYLPHNWHLFGEDKAAANGRYAVLATSLGCPYSCTFCAISSLFGAKKVRFFDVDTIIKEIDILVKEYNIKYIKMTDECFVLNKEYIERFCDELIKRNYDLNIWGYARIDTVSAEMLDKLKRAGIKWLAFGVESGSTKSLNGVAKGQFDNEKVKRVINMVKKAGIYTLTDFMFGLPDDDRGDMEASYNLCREINPEWINFYVTMPYPGSQLYQEYIDNGEKLAEEWIAYAQYSYECTPKGSKYLTPAQVLEYRDWAFNAFFTDNEKYFNNIESKFGENVVTEIKEMTRNKLKRKLLGD